MCGRGKSARVEGNKERQGTESTSAGRNSPERGLFDWDEMGDGLSTTLHPLCYQPRKYYE